MKSSVKYLSTYLMLDLPCQMDSNVALHLKMTWILLTSVMAVGEFYGDAGEIQ